MQERQLDALLANNREQARELIGPLPVVPGSELFLAAALGDLERVAAILADDPGAAARPCGPHAFAPLLYTCYSHAHHIWPACAGSMAAVARLLIANGADPNSEHIDPYSPDSPLPALYAAVGVANNPAVARALLQAGARPNDSESIYHAAEHNHRECLELLLEHGADISARAEPWDNTPLYFLSGYRDASPGHAAADEGARWLLEHGANPNVTSYAAAETPLQLAVRCGKAASYVCMLLEHGADPLAQRADGRTARSLAVRFGRRDLYQLLGVDNNGSQADLLDRFVGAAMAADENQVRAMMVDDPGIVRLLGPEDRGMIVEAATNGDVAAVRLMLNVGFDCAAPGAEAGATALHHAAWWGNAALVRLLLDHDAPLDARDAAYEGTPLDWAVHGSRYCRAAADADYGSVARALIAAGASTIGANVALASPAVAEALALAGG